MSEAIESNLAKRIRSLARVIRSGALIGATMEDGDNWYRDLMLAAQACNAVRMHRENQRGIATLRTLATELGISMMDLSAIAADHDTDTPPDLICKRS